MCGYDGPTHGLQPNLTALVVVSILLWGINEKITEYLLVVKDDFDASLVAFIRVFSGATLICNTGKQVVLCLSYSMFYIVLELLDICMVSVCFRWNTNVKHFVVLLRNIQRILYFGVYDRWIISDTLIVLICLWTYTILCRVGN